MQITSNYIFENLMYDMIIDNFVKYHGNMDYISQHFSDGDKIEFHISESQNTILKPLVDEYHAVKNTEPNLSFEAFLKRKAI